MRLEEGSRGPSRACRRVKLQSAAMRKRLSLGTSGEVQAAWRTGGGNGGTGVRGSARGSKPATMVIPRQSTGGPPEVTRPWRNKRARGEDVVLPSRRHGGHERRPKPARDLTGGGRGRGGPGRPRWPGQRGPGVERPKGTRLRPAGHRRRDTDHRPRAQGRGRCRPGRIPECGQVLTGRGHLPRAAEDRRLPVHHAGAQPGRGGGRRPHLHGCRRARPDRGASAGVDSGSTSAAPSAARPWCMWSTAPLPARSGSADRCRGVEAELAAHGDWRIGRAGRVEQGRRGGRRRARRLAAADPARPRLAGLSGLHQDRPGLSN